MRMAGKIGIGLLVVIGVLAIFLLWPISTPATPASEPAANYEEAMAHIAQADANVAGPLFPGCETTALTHGEATEEVIVYFHGYKSCPLQFAALGQQLYEMGYNVYMPRMPRMGLEDKYAPEQADLVAEDVMAYMQEALDVAQGLGDEVTVVGLSGGGGLATWVAQNRDDVQKVVAISPLIVPGAVPAPVINQAVRIYGTLPNQFQWQDAELKADIPNPDYVYPRNATRVVSEILRIPLAARKAAAREAPAVPEILMVTNGADEVVNKDVVAEIVDNWRKNGAENVAAYEFPEEYELTHDLIAHDHPFQDIKTSHPILIDLITE